MVAEKKRPRGLKGSAAAKANKKIKAEESSTTTPTEIPANAQTVVIDKEVEEGDEIGETVALFESALQKLEEDPTAALSLLRGTVHESDRILRNWNSETPLPSIYYLTYGSALYELGRLSDDEDFEQYLEAAEERLNDGLSLGNIDKDLLTKYNLALVKIWLAKAANDISESQQEVPELSIRALDTLNKMKDDHIPTKTKIELADIVLSHGDLFNDLESRNKFINWSENTLADILKDQPCNTDALAEMGACKLVIGNYWLDQLGDEEEDESKVALTEEEKKAYDAFADSRKYYKSAKEELAQNDLVTPKILTDLAESYLNEANLMVDEEEQKKMYNETAAIIKEASDLIKEKKLDFELPEGLCLFLEEFEN
ncbi:nuclear pore complex subunit Nro1-domain-containing protein [Pilobolus umbonatus]|nr:nuclear pore complex subunit Nro1-domain-containing protein [Pilobolus umbonatus]